MANRNEIIQRAKDILQENPSVSRRFLAAQLRHEFGKALRASEILKIKQQYQVKPYSETFAEQKKQRLISEGLLPEEALFYIKSGYGLSHLGVRKVRNYRKREIERAKKIGIKNTEKYIRDSYAASGWIDKDGTLRPDFYNEKVFEQLTAKRKDRKRTVLIEPENYRSFQKVVVKDKFSAGDAAHMASIIPPDQWATRMAQYKYLRRTFRSHVEAYQIITATSKDKQGNIILQSLDLNDAAWQQDIQERLNYANARIREARKKGMSYYEARKAVLNEIYNKTKNNEPSDSFDWLKSFYKFAQKNKPTTDFDTALRNRQRHLEKRKMLYRTRR